MARYAVPRLTIGPKTNELKITIGRTLSVADDFSNVKLLLERRNCSNSDIYEFVAYEVCDGVAHFEIPDEFVKSKVTKGFYDASVIVDDCEITSIEVIKAPSRFVKEARAVESDCTVNDAWEEPPCEDEEYPCDNCGCFDKVDSGCPNCIGNNTIVDVPIIDEYTGEF